MITIDANNGGSIAADDRGLAYGDGCFETMRVCDGRIPLLHWHKQRLQRTSETLRLPCRDIDAWWAALQQHLEQYPEIDWVKMIVTRGSGRRGYSPDGAKSETLVFSSGIMAQTDSQHLGNVTLAAAPATESSLTVGIKHLSRLPEVLRAAAKGAAAEQLVCDVRGNLVCGIMSNVFIVNDGVLRTPLLDTGGVAGVMREWIGAEFPVTCQRLTIEDALLADEVFMCNALRGVRRVAAICQQPTGRDNSQSARVMSRLEQTGFRL